MFIKENFELKGYNTFDIDAKCKYFVETDSEDELLDFVKEYELNPEEIIILGGGSNYLFTEDFEGTVIYPKMQGIEVIYEDNEGVFVKVGAGVDWDYFVEWAVDHGYGGIENLSLIPGHVGASPVQNVGAYGMEAGETIKKIDAIDLIGLEKVSIDSCYFQFGYRDSIFKREWKNHFIITYVYFGLYKNPKFNLEYSFVAKEVERLGEVNLKNIRKAVINIRNSKLPNVKETPNAGSFFKNPIVLRDKLELLQADFPDIPYYELDEEKKKLAAGWLIEKAGWKGKSLGRAAVHDKQALVLVNLGGASGIEIAHLANEVKKDVFLKFGIWLEPEVNII